MTHKDKAVAVLKRILELAESGRTVTFSHRFDTVVTIDDHHFHFNDALINNPRPSDKEIIEVLYSSVKYPMYDEVANDTE